MEIVAPYLKQSEANRRTLELASQLVKEEGLDWKSAFYKAYQEIREEAMSQSSEMSAADLTRSPEEQGRDQPVVESYATVDELIAGLETDPPPLN